MKSILATLLFVLFSLCTFGEANYVYHEATTNTIGPNPLQFRNILTPNRTESVNVAFKIEWQFYWNQARIYYTTDGSNPSGAFGIGSGTTQVVNALFNYNFGSPLVDVVVGTIPAQPAGTTVKYIVSAWFDTGGDEIFGNGCGNAPNPFCTTEKRPASNATVFSYRVTETLQKTFSSSNTFPTNLDGANGNCTTPGTTAPNVFNVTVSGVGTMTNLNQLLLASIELSDCGTGSKNMNAVQIRIMSPTGQCYGIYSGGLSTIATNTHYLNLVSATNCLNNPNTSNDNQSGAEYSLDGNNGYFNAQFNGVGTNYSNFTGNADGTWKIIFSESTTSPPCVESIKLTFGDPNVIQQGTTGDNCINPIVWDGKSPICANTTGMTGSTQMPGSIGGPNTNSFGTIDGRSCGWNFANNNDVWIKYVATENTTCLSISGISGTNVALQSIVVTDANADNDNNPCTQVSKTATNDPNWKIASCPRDSIYTTTAGTQKNQQHCFTSEIGKTYYLVVDGDGGANSKFWIWGYGYNQLLNSQEQPVWIRPVRPEIKTNVAIVNGILKTEIENRRTQKQSVIIFNSTGKTLYKNVMNVVGNLSIDINWYLVSGMNFIKVMLENERYEQWTFKILK